VKTQANTLGDSKLLVVEQLHSQFRGDRGPVRAVDGVSFELGRGEVVGLVGESGCGKSATCMSIMRLLPAPYGRIVSGSIRLSDVELTGLSEAEMRRIRGHRISMIFQDPMTSLNPYLRIDEQLTEVGTLHLGITQAEALSRAVKLLDRVGIPDAARRVRDYPHQLSGGMRQRVMIAMALLCNPEILIADEPTTALDVTIQAQILDLLLELREERGLSILLVTHDLGVIAGSCDRVIVMYAGRIVEVASTQQLFEAPAHPYTHALLKSVPSLDPPPGGRLSTIEGTPPRLDLGRFTECSFAPRCPLVREACHDGEPELAAAGLEHVRRCIVPADEVRARSAS
jgi:oligopeptide/dipeptide ABC transporter ATP-binding protein